MLEVVVEITLIIVGIHLDCCKPCPTCAMGPVLKSLYPDFLCYAQNSRQS